MANDDFSHGLASDEDITMEKPKLTRTKSSGVYTISPELFEKLYLTPKVPHRGDNIKRFANPTPMGFVGFAISIETFSMILMGWGGAGSLNAVVGIFLFVGPLLLTLTAIFEWIMGNFFSMMVCSLFAVFDLSFGLLNLPTLQLAASYSSSGTSAAEGEASVEYNAALALYMIVWGFALLTFFVFTLKTNVVFAATLFCVTTAAWVIAGAYWRVAAGDYVAAGHLQKAAGALFFVAGLLGWYMTFVMMAAETRMAVNLPVGNLSHLWPATDVEMATSAKHT